MLIKLQPDQIPLFWSLIKHGIIQSNRIPREHQLAVTNKRLEQLLSGNHQCWVGYEIDEEGNKRITGILCTRILDEQDYGIKTLVITAVYSLRLITEKLVNESIEALEEFARANGCSVLYTEYTSERVKELLNQMGFEDYTTISKKYLY